MSHSSYSEIDQLWKLKISEVLKNCIDSLGLDKKLYDTHSLRIGRTHDLFK